MIAKLRHILGLQTAEEKLEEYTLLKGELSDINDRTDILAEDYVTKLNGFNGILKSESYGTEIKERVQKRYTHFLQEQKKEVIGLVNRRHKIEKRITSILKDEKIKDAVNEFELLEKAKSNYRDGNISKNVYNDIIKAKKGKVHYSDNFVFWNGKLLLIQRATDDDGANKWGVPGGHVDAGESHEDAAVRELQEETGLVVDNVVLAGTYSNDDVMIEYYTSYIESDTEPQLILDTAEHQSYRWIDLYRENIDEFEFPFNMKENIKKLLLPKEEKPQDISKAVNMFIDGFISKEVLSDIVKARSGIYENTSENRRLRRVGQPYGTKKGEDTKETKEPAKQEETVNKEGKDIPIDQHARQASETALQEAAKGGNEELRVAAKKELDRREKEETVEQPEEKKEVDISSLDEKGLRDEIKKVDEKLAPLNEELDKLYSDLGLFGRISKKKENKDWVELTQKQSKLRESLIKLKEGEDKKSKPEKEKGEKKDSGEVSEDKKRQFDIIQKTNPMLDEYHVGIRKPQDIKTFDEVVNDEESFVWGDFSKEDAEKALKEGVITLYSSKPINQGVFVSTSKVQAEQYAGGVGKKIHSKKVKLEDVAWINGDEGQFASLSNNKEDKIEKSEQNELRGGKADNLSLKDIAQKHKVSIEEIKKQLKAGIKVEMEHTDDPKKAVEIALDHLVESPIYYDELEKMESKFHDKE